MKGSICVVVDHLDLVVQMFFDEVMWVRSLAKWWFHLEWRSFSKWSKLCMLLILFHSARGVLKCEHSVFLLVTLIRCVSSQNPRKRNPGSKLTCLELLIAGRSGFSYHKNPQVRAYSYCQRMDTSIIPMDWYANRSYSYWWELCSIYKMLNEAAWHHILGWSLRREDGVARLKLRLFSQLKLSPNLSKADLL